MNNQKNIVILGGDARQLIVASNFIKKGFNVNIYGFGGENRVNSAVDSNCCSPCNALPSDILKNISMADTNIGKVCSTVQEALENCFAVILPLPLSNDNINVSVPLSNSCELSLKRLYELIIEYNIKIVFGGKIPCEFRDICLAKGVKIYDYYLSEKFAIANAIPTAEGALEIAIRELPITLNTSSALIVGYGRIGKMLAKLLCAFGTNVFVSARKPVDLAWIKAYGYKAVKTDEIYKALEKQKFDVIFNTVPHTVLGKREFEHIKNNTLIIDLASKPGGVDISCADSEKCKLIWALSLPGKTSPITSGQIIFDVINGYLDDIKEERECL